MKEEIVIAGFGGQGIILMGKLLAYAAMIEERNVTYLPSYGPEMRGGTANCMVIISDSEIGSPYIFRPSSLIAMNDPSLQRFTPVVQPNGFILSNSGESGDAERADLSVARIQAKSIAEEMGNARVANMVALGAFVCAKPVVSLNSLHSSLKKNSSKFGKALLHLNEEAIRRGAQSVEIGKRGI